MKYLCVIFFVIASITITIIGDAIIEHRFEQYELKKQQMLVAKNSNNRVNDELDLLLKNIPDSILARLSLVHEDRKSVSSSSLPLLRWDVVYARASPNYDRGPGHLLQNMPLVLWRDYIDRLIEGECAFMRVSELSEPASRENLTSMGILSFDVCPLLTKNHQLMGALFLSWPTSNPEHDTKDMMSIVRKTANTVASLLEEDLSK